MFLRGDIYLAFWSFWCQRSGTKLSDTGKGFRKESFAVSRKHDKLHFFISLILTERKIKAGEEMTLVLYLMGILIGCMLVYRRAQCIHSFGQISIDIKHVY